MPDNPSLADAAAALRAGGVVAYPTEAVYGLGCDPGNQNAFERLFAIKRRPPTQGVLLIAADFADLAPFIDGSAVPPASCAGPSDALHAGQEYRPAAPGTI